MHPRRLEPNWKKSRSLLTSGPVHIFISRRGLRAPPVPIRSSRRPVRTCLR